MKFPSQPTQVLDIVPLVENAGFPEQSGPEHVPLVQEIGNGVGILLDEPDNTGSKTSNSSFYQLFKC